MQAVDSAELSLKDFKLRAGFSLAGSDFSRPRRDVTSALKTVLWTYNLCELTGTSRPYGLERRFEPKALWRDTKGNRLRSNKWPGYAQGRHEPRSVLGLIEKACPGANDCLRSPLWPALTASPLTSRQIETLMRRLQPPTQALMAVHGLWPCTTDTSPKLMDGKFAAALERRACLDKLAAIVLLLRRAHAEGHPDISYRWGEKLWRMMVLLGPVFLGGGIAKALSELVAERIMPMADLEGIRYGFPPGRYTLVARGFAEARNNLVVIDLTRKAHQRPATGERLLDYKSGWDYRYAFNPIPLVTDDVWLLGLPKLALREARWAQERWFCHTWGLNMLSRGRHPSAPPTAVRTGADLWAVAPEDPFMQWLTKRTACRNEQLAAR